MSIKNILPSTVRRAIFDNKMLRNAWFATLDSYDLVNGKRDSLTPPRKLQHAIGSAYSDVGSEYFDYFINLGELKSSDYILDVGCGCGSMAVKLSKYLSDKGVYEGFDIMMDCVKWCQSHITPQYSNMKFMHADIYNKEYNPKGKTVSSNFQFPYPDNYFDFIIITSVFTHLLPKDFTHYCSEVSRVLKIGGCCFSTFLLLNNESAKGILDGKSLFNFKEQPGGYSTTNPEIPEVAIGFDEDFVVETLAKHNLKIKQPIHYGSWSGRTNFLSAQDIIISNKI